MDEDGCGVWEKDPKHAASGEFEIATKFAPMIGECDCHEQNRQGKEASGLRRDCADEKSPRIINALVDERRTPGKGSEAAECAVERGEKIEGDKGHASSSKRPMRW